MRTRIFLVITFWMASPAFADLLDEELQVEPPAKSEGLSDDDDEEGTIRPVSPDTPAKSQDSRPEEKAGNKAPPAKPVAKPDPRPRVLAPTTSKTSRKENERKKPVKYQSKGLVGLRDKGTLEFKEDFVISQGTLKLEGDTAKVFFDEATDEVQRVIAEGHIKMFRYDEDSGEQIKAFGDKVTFLNDERKVILEGNARLFRGPNLMRGDRLVYELDTGWIRAEKVEGELHPDQGE